MFQHASSEHPGSLRRYLAEDGIHWDAVELDEGGQIPDLDDYDVLWVMGGPMDVWDVTEHPWLVEEKRAIHRWVEEDRKPFLGFCLGHQLLADALGGTCGPARNPEIGILDIELNDNGVADPIFAGLPRKQKCLQWHSVEVAQPPEGATVLASSPNCRVQAMRIGSNVWSMQYHLEIEDDTVDEWCAIPAYETALQKNLGPEGIDRMRRDSSQGMAELNAAARTFYMNFMRLIAQP